MYDTVIAGGGTAGAIVAARLTENPQHRVLLLEAGPDYPGPAATPADLLDSRNIAGPAHDWRYTAIPLEGRTMPYQRGKVTGGTSAINAAAALWARPADFARWVRLGNDAWSWRDVEPWFKRLEADREGGGAHHGRDGPVVISRYAAADLIPIQRAFFAGCRSAGIPEVRDHNALEGAGVGPWPMNRDGITRLSSAISHLGAARTRQNLTLGAGALVDCLVFDGDRAAGVRLADGRIERARRVVLAAGSIGSPAILMRSGIGPARQLQALGIEPRLDRPGVGARLWDHAAVPIRLVPLPGECVIGRDPRFQIMARFTAPGSALAEDMQLVMTTHLDLSASPALQAEAGVKVVAVLRAALMLPRGHGTLSLVSRDPAVQPRIALNYCADAEDLRRLIAGVRLAWTVVKSKEMAGAYRLVAGLDDGIVGSDERLAGYIRANIGTYCHALGTAPIGPDGDPTAVADQRFKVRGLENLYIVDASVFPAVPGAVPNLTIMMLAERAAGWLAAA